MFVCLSQSVMAAITSNMYVHIIRHNQISHEVLRRHHSQSKEEVLHSFIYIWCKMFNQIMNLHEINIIQHYANTFTIKCQPKYQRPETVSNHHHRLSTVMLRSDIMLTKGPTMGPRMSSECPTIFMFHWMICSCAPQVLL